ncbi:LysR family transcriptional regulator [Bosea caraganae]|uniref:LysR family transcriptional regulator n=1 Tax=Bosea caraganae TaxID=2763117 RepID=A0A370L7H2_9HYPH|nr:LysR family transcriptional regulator [Bosea caraganae]RDJ23124.1 LysR family transcriptional regulator [Bosea caraganae]RDJ24763.1 LysR family transcriptional regulator [Bosea caraganae]
MRLDQLSGLVAFLKVAETRSFTRAAAELGVAPPSLSEAVRGLEARLGVRLLNRTTRSVGLTEAGAAYLERVRPAAEEIQAAGAALDEARDHPVGTLRLSLPWIAGPLLIEPLMGPFLAAYPDVALDLVFDDGFVDLAAHGFDAGFRIGELLEKDMVALRLGGPLRFALLASPAYLAEHGTPERPADLARHRCIAYRFASTRAVASWEFSENGRDVSFTPTPRLSVNTMPLMVEAAVQGAGLAFAPERLAAAHLHEGRLIKVMAAYCPSYEPFHIYYPSRRLTPPKLKVFVEFARSHAGR